MPVAVAKRQKYIDQPGGGEAAGQRGFLDQRHPASLPRRLNRGGDPGDAAADDDKIVTHGRGSCILRSSASLRQPSAQKRLPISPRSLLPISSREE